MTNDPNVTASPKIKSDASQIVGTADASKQSDKSLRGAAANSYPRSKRVWTAQELLSADLPPPRWVVPDLIPVGLSMLAGRPKIGKSVLALQLAHAVGTGGTFSVYQDESFLKIDFIEL